MNITSHRAHAARLVAGLALAVWAGAASAAVTAHLNITAYNGPSTCIACHAQAATDMLSSLHMKWAGPTPDVTNSGGRTLGKAVGGINSFCTYAMSSKSACFNCHVRADGNAPHAATANDVDCLMCHNDVYQRKFTLDTAHPITVTNVLGQTKTYYAGLQEADGDYVSQPDFAAMPAGTTMVDLARNVARPTKKSCLRCHAKAGGSDWAKRGDMGVNSAAPTVDQDFHMSASGANLNCTSCHKATNHKIGGRGIDLRQTEGTKPTCTACHPSAPHLSSTTNRHATGRVACQVCHIQTYAKGGATEMSRDWTVPTWNAAFCNGQGGFIGEELKLANAKPEYVWFSGKSYVYSVGDTIAPDATGIVHMAKASGAIFDGVSKIVPIKRHFSVMAMAGGKIVPPMINWMFMTGDFDTAIQEGMKEQGLSGPYTMVDVDAEMLITHGVDPKSKAPACTACHATNGNTTDGTLMLPFGKLGYHVWPAKVKACTLCHSAYSASFSSMHDRHRSLIHNNCKNCHQGEPTGLVKPTSDLCNDCHGSQTWQGASSHKKHVTRYDCSKCHKFI